MKHCFNDLAGKKVTLTFDRSFFSPAPKHVLVFAIHEGKLVMTKHKRRGWELPGGKVNPGEQVEEAAFREMWEETGIILSAVERIGEYIVEQGGGRQIIKAIFLASVDRIEPLPSGFETEGYKLFPLTVDTKGEGFSPYVQDGVFAITRDYIMRNLSNS